MRRDGWTLRSALWFVFLVALGLKAAAGTWLNLKRGSVEYHQQLAERCEWMSAREQNTAAELEDEASSRFISDPAISTELRKMALGCDWSAKSHSLLAASLREKAESCEKSRLGWIFCQYETWRKPPNVPARNASGVRPRPWLENATLAALSRHPVMMALGRVDFFWLACLVLAITGRRWFARAWGLGGPPVRTDLAPN